MSAIPERGAGLIGNTPLLRLAGVEEAEGLAAALYGKFECFNPAGSVKDRVALAMLEDAERRGVLAPGGLVVEPTSGNTGIGLAAVGIPRGYRVLLTMPETMSVERQSLLRAFGAELELTPGSTGMQGAIDRARELLAQNEGAFMPGQFDNPANPAAHEASTGPELWQALDGQLDAFVAGVGTGGTLSGVGRYLKRQSRSVRVVAAEPAASPVLQGGKPGPHKLQGIGANFVPGNFDAAVCDEVIGVEAEEAFRLARLVAATTGILVGISSGAALSAAVTLARRSEMAGRSIALILPDTGERYLSTALFE